MRSALCLALWLGACDDPAEVTEPRTETAPAAAHASDPEAEAPEPDGPLLVSTESGVAAHARITLEGARVTRSLATMAPAVNIDFRVHNDGERDLRIFGIRDDGTAVFVDSNGSRLPIFGGNDELEVPAGGSAVSHVSFDTDSMEGATVRFWGVAYPLPSNSRTQAE